MAARLWKGKQQKEGAVPRLGSTPPFPGRRRFSLAPRLELGLDLEEDEDVAENSKSHYFLVNGQKALCPGQRENQIETQEMLKTLI